MKIGDAVISRFNSLLGPQHIAMRFALIYLMIFCPHVAAASNFVTVKLQRGVELQLPKGWWLLTTELNQLIEMSAEAAMDLSGLGAAEGTEVNRIAANSMPRTTYAAVRVVSTTPVSGSQSEISNLTEAELHAFQCVSPRKSVSDNPAES